MTEIGNLDVELIKWLDKEKKKIVIKKWLDKEKKKIVIKFGENGGEIYVGDMEKEKQKFN